MASNITRVPLIRALARLDWTPVSVNNVCHNLVCLRQRRGFAAAASPSECQAGDIHVTVSKTDSNLTYASYDNNAPVVSVSVSVKAGSRYETPDALGASNVLRSCAGLATKCYSKFAIVRLIEEAGASLTAINERDTITYTLECLRNQLSTCLPVLGAVASQQCFKPWELSDNIPRLQIELAQVTEQARVMDLLHTAAYRNGLGNSIFVPKFRLGSLNPETMQYFYENNFGSNRASVGAIGLNPTEIKCFTECITLSPIPECGTPSKYYGGELRKPAAGPNAHVAIAVEGAGLNNVKQAAALTVLKHGLGTGPGVLWGNNTSSPLAKAASEAAGGCAVPITAFNISHSDSGLFGINLIADTCVAGKVVEAAVGVLRNVKVTDDLVARGKAGAKLAVYSAAEKSSNLSEDLAHQALLLGSVTTPGQLASIIDQLTNSDISSAASTATSGKMSLAALGDLRTVPYLADLK